MNRVFHILVVLALGLRATHAIEMRNAWSPENRSRPERTSTLLIVIHTTEAPFRSALGKIRERGEANYIMDTSGVTYRIVERDRIAYHAGRSMWDGRANVDTFSVGIEVTGTYNREPTPGQVAALKELIAYLKGKYNIPDDRVLTHSMVAYGTPNRWHKQSHRGRKRCGMMFAVKSVRRSLGLESEPLFDPDVKSGRLVAADPLLASVLYGKTSEQEVAKKAEESATNVVQEGRSAWDIAREAYDDPDTVYVLPNGQKLTGDKVGDWAGMPTGTLVMVHAEVGDSQPGRIKTVGAGGATPHEMAGEECNRSTTVYFLPDGRTRYGKDIGDNPLDAGTRVLVGYRFAGSVTSKRSAFDICGALWRSPHTYYRMPTGALLAGSAVSEKAIPRNAMVFVRN